MKLIDYFAVTKHIHRMPPTPEQLEAGIALYVSGKTSNQAAFEIGVPEATFRYYIKKLGVTRPHLGHGPKPKVPDEQAQAIAEKYLAGRSAHGIAVEMHIPNSSLRRMLARLGILRTRNG